MNQKVQLILPKNIQIFLKREDLLHPHISGNKFRKLKYNLLEARKLKVNTILTSGGAFSNHILATAAAAKENDFKAIGVIRGEELVNQYKENPTLVLAEQFGMKFYFVDRETFRLKNDNDFIAELKNEFGDFYLVPEGGSNDLAIKGCEEILTNDDSDFDYICCAVGTGGTISGLINSSNIEKHKIIGFSALKGDFLNDDIRKFAKQDNWKLITDYHFGGYGKVKPELITFLNEFYAQTRIPLDPIYTGKMMFGIVDLIEKGFFPDNAKILAIHTGGLQGIKGINRVLKNKKREYLIYEE